MLHAASLLNGDVVAPAIGVGVFSMLVALFTLVMRSIENTGQRVDQRADAELARLLTELEETRTERDQWRERYVTLLERRQQ